MEGEGDPAVRRGSANRMKNRGKKGEKKEGTRKKEKQVLAYRTARGRRGALISLILRSLLLLLLLVAKRCVSFLWSVIN